MKRLLRFCSLLLVFSVAVSLCACGKTPGKVDTPNTPSGMTVDAMHIGVLFPDSAAAGTQSYFHLLGIEKAAAALKIPNDPIYQKNITDVRFPENGKLEKPDIPETTEEQTTVKPTEPESFTDKDGNVFIQAVPVTPKKEPTAAEAMYALLDGGCNILIAVDPIYDDFTAWVAAQYPNKTFLQYKGTHTDLANLQSYDDNMFEAFYLAGAAAGAAGAKNVGFVAGSRTEQNRKYINAFALGLAESDEKSKVTVRFTGVPFDLSLERTVPETLLTKDKCDGIAQSVFTALPQTVAANQDNNEKRESVLCIGFGYDMAADGGEKSLCAVQYNYEAYFSDALTALRDGTFSAKPYVGGVVEGVVGLSDIRSEDEKVKAKVDTLKKSFENGQAQIELPAKGYCKNVTVK